jgi:hypothetical protein
MTTMLTATSILDSLFFLYLMRTVLLYPGRRNFAR